MTELKTGGPGWEQERVVQTQASYIRAFNQCFLSPYYMPGSVLTYILCWPKSQQIVFIPPSGSLQVIGGPGHEPHDPTSRHKTAAQIHGAGQEGHGKLP